MGQVFSDDHVFLEDGTTFKNLRDAVSAASKTGMWHIAWELAHRYDTHDSICLSCGHPSLQQESTYITRSGLAIRLCLPCFKRLPQNF